MIKSKALKSVSNEKASKLYLWWIETAISEIYYDLVRDFITNPIFQIKRLYQWYVNVFKTDFDFDGHSLFAIIEYKLKRLQDNLKDGFSIQESKDIKALKLAIKLAGRLKDDKYENIFMDRHDAKWGELKLWSTPVKGSKHHRMHSSRPKAKTKKQKENEIKDFRAAYEAAHAMAKREERWMYDILHKYLRNLWD